MLSRSRNSLISHLEISIDMEKSRTCILSLIPVPCDLLHSKQSRLNLPGGQDPSHSSIYISILTCVLNVLAREIFVPCVLFQGSQGQVFSRRALRDVSYMSQDKQENLNKFKYIGSIQLLTYVFRS